MEFSWKISWRNLTRKKLRTLFTFLAITIGVAATLAVSSTVETTSRTVAEFVHSFNAKAHMQITGTDSTFAYPFMEELENTKGVLLALAHLSQPVRLELSSLAVDPEVSEPNTKTVLHGYSSFENEWLDWQAEEGSLHNSGLVITAETAEKWNVSVGQLVIFQVGDKRREIAVSAIVGKNEELPSPSSWDSTRVSRWHVAVPLEVLQAWTDMTDYVRDIQLRVADGQGTEVAARLEALLKAYPDTYLDPIILNESDLFYGLDDIYSALYMLGALGLLMSAVILFSTLYVSVVERRREFAVMKTIGCTPLQVASIVLREVLLLAVLGTAAGIALGIGLAYGMTDSFMHMLDDVDQEGQAVIVLSQQAIGLSVAVGLIGSLLAALIPLYNASKISVSYALRHSVTEGAGTRGYAEAAIGAALIMIGLWLSSTWRVLPLFIGLLLVFPVLMRIVQMLLLPIVRLIFGFEGIIASTGVARQLRRMSMASAILCIGLSFLLTVGFLRDSLERSVEQSVRYMVGGDIVLNTTVPLTNEDIRKARAADGIAGVSAIKTTTVVWRGETDARKMSLIGVKEQSSDSIAMFTSEAPSVSDINRLLQEPYTIALGHAVYKAWNGQVGERITLNTPKGKQALRVVAVVHSIQENGNIAFVADKHMPSEFDIVDSMSMSVLLQPGVSQEAVKRQMVQQFGERLSGVRKADEFLESRKEELIIPFTMMNSLLALIVLISGVGILNTLLMNVFERTREIGTMRAVGSTPWQVRKMVFGEGFIVGICAIVAAIGLGLSLAYAMSANRVLAGFPLAFFIPWESIALIAAFGLFISLISAWLPAVLASRIPLNEALHYE